MALSKVATGYHALLTSGDYCSRTCPPPMRSKIPYVEQQAAKLYRQGIRRLVGFKRYGIKINPVVAIHRESDFITRYRFPKVVICRISVEFASSPYWEKTDGKKECCKKFVNAQWVVCIGIRYLATGACLTLLCDVQGQCCKSTLSTNVNRFISFLAWKAFSTINFPTSEAALAKLERKCSQKYGISGCVAFADGTFVPIITPVVNEKAFFCRKYYHALNVLLICDADMRILAVDAGFGGAHADSTVFESSAIGKRIKYDGILKDYYLIGDCGYSLTEYMMTPFREKQLAERKSKAVEDYQKKVTGSRSVIEQCNAQLKGRWRVLSKYGSGMIVREPGQVELIVHACCYLHNLALDEGLTPITRELQHDPEMEPLLRQNSLVFLLNCVKRNRHRQFKAHYRRQNPSEYEKGYLKREQILREQFGERGVKLGRIAKRGRGRPLGTTNAARRARQQNAQQQAAEPQPGPSSRR